MVGFMIFQISNNFLNYASNRFSFSCSPRFPLVAEIACSHDGNPWECSKLIEAASQIGADAIQLQVLEPS